MFDARFMPLIQVSSFAAANVKHEIARTGKVRDQTGLDPIVEVSEDFYGRIAPLFECLLRSLVVMVSYKFIFL